MAEKAESVNIAKNKKAFHEYQILETFECGLVLKGAEVKTLREGRVEMRESFARVDGNEVFVYQMHIPEWKNASQWDKPKTDRPRKLLLHARQIDQLIDATNKKGLTLIPLSLYFMGGRAKLSLGVARGKKLHDKRASMAEKTAKLDAARELREMNK